MKSRKSYTVRIDGNKSKLDYLHQQLSEISKLSKFAFEQGDGEWDYVMPLYHASREKFPDLNSKIVQNFLKYHFITPNRKMKPKQPPKASIIIDQNFGFKIDEVTKLTNYWIRFHKQNFPLLGLEVLQKITNPSNVKLIQIYKSWRGKLYCKLTVVKEVLDQPTPDEIPKSVGLDINARRIVLGNNKFYHLKKHHHRKTEHKKHFPRKKGEKRTRREVRASHKLSNYTKDTIHKLTTEIANNLQANDTEVLVFEDLTHLRKSASRKLGTSKGKKVNGIVNSIPFKMFQNFLEYKCLDRSIDVVYVNPAYTSKMCSKCGSYNTTRKQTAFKCLTCGIMLDADLTGQETFRRGITCLNGLRVNLALYRTFKSVGSHNLKLW